jgi:hypothetical protein
VKVRTIVVEKCPACSGRSLLPTFKRGDGLPLAHCCDCGCLFLHEYPENPFAAYDAQYFVKTHERAADVGYNNYLNDVSPLDFLRHLAALEATRLVELSGRRAGRRSGSVISRTGPARGSNNFGHRYQSPEPDKADHLNER